MVSYRHKVSLLSPSVPVSEVMSSLLVPHKRKDIQGLFPECVDIWDYNLGDEERKNLHNNNNNNKLLMPCV